MYLLNDKHSKYEYTLYTRVGSAAPYLTHTYYSLDDIIRKSKEIEKRHNHYRQVFYIDNDFYENHYSENMNGVYYKFLRRPVYDWEEFTTQTDENLKFAKIIQLYK